MPPRRKSAPAGRVYKSATPLQQTKLANPKKRIKSYGKQTTRRAKEDSTLTQIGFVKLKDRPEEESEEEEEEEEDEESDYEKASKKRKSKRRKTEGDKPSATPQYHTQTITQLDWSFSTINDDEEEASEEVQGDVEERGSIFDVPSSSQSVHLPRNFQRLSGPASAGPSRREESPILDRTREETSNLEMPPPQTPRRVLPQEIPSSQSPATPLSIQSRGSTRQRSPLKEKPVNAPIPFNTNRKAQNGAEKRPKLKIEDTFESRNTTSQVGDIPFSPDKPSSPAKSVRFALPEREVEEEVETPATPSIKKESTPYPSQMATQQQIKFEIFDSDEDEEDDLDEEEASNQAEIDAPESAVSVSQPQHDEEPETFYGDIGRETQFEADRIVSSLAETTSSNISGDTDESEKVTSGVTQTRQTQRISIKEVNSMAPRTENSDIFISIHPQHVTNIVNRTKNHERRSWAFSPSVCRVWIYETKPACLLKYMAEISPAKKPGEILDTNGLGNAEFNSNPRKKSWNAYEILQLYELVDLVPLSRIVSNGWMKAAPQKFAWVPPAVADELIANLKPPLFTNTTQTGSSPSDPASSSTDTQEVEEQLLNTISQFTQPAQPSPSLQSSGPATSESIIVKAETMPPPSSFHQETPGRPSSPPHLSQAETVDLTQTPLPNHPSQAEEDEIVWESPARPVASSTPLKLPTPRSARSDRHGPDSILPYSMSSSQFLSRSQLLPESLLNEVVPGPPQFVHDSDSEDDEL
ncbi:uncharacterized protein LY89DRAFT_204834 [Mollisia scopiformis]|uniref:Uncharacterized protein n=1 Tax=Mollisia scopiformis TaxID=149040 RepID=A0A194WXI4_MOLSC|nr:uncharacterized protein LY89DRAFT_204834 [Mollisia scopiformis]KUJ12292.1 hypothetical protein LY89DRAFT_204834 [Mollisia scopiformis]